jgi:hypothetical protein
MATVTAQHASVLALHTVCKGPVAVFAIVAIVTSGTDIVRLLAVINPFLVLHVFFLENTNEL